MEHAQLNQELITYLSGFVSETRRNKFDEVLNFRTRYLTIVLEDLYQPHNASAVLRSCDIFGIQDIHIIENKNAYTVHRDIALGSPKWLTTHKYQQHANNTLACITSLKEKGYKIVATSPNEKSKTLENLSIDKPIALVFGTELTGISETIKEHADEFVHIPMFGFTESFNLSVSAALCLHNAISKLHKSDIAWNLTALEKEELLLRWLRNSIKKVEFLEKDFLEKKGA